MDFIDYCIATKNYSALEAVKQFANANQQANVPNPQPQYKWGSGYQGPVTGLTGWNNNIPTPTNAKRPRVNKTNVR